MTKPLPYGCIKNTPLTLFEKNKKVNACERSTLQLINVLSRNEERDIINSFNSRTKTHSILDNKKYILLSIEHLHF